METHFSFAPVAAMFGAMLVLALLPGVSVLLVTTRAAGHGFAHGLFATLGIILGDVFFILLAIYGLSALSGAMGDGFSLIKYLGGAYLIWLGLGLCRRHREAQSSAGSNHGQPACGTQASLFSSLMAGLLVTLGDQKAMLFYLGFFPAFIDMASLSITDAAIIVACAASAIGMAKLMYVFLAVKAGARLANSTTSRRIHIAAGVVMLGIGVLLITRG